ncbi:olfactory receptor 1509-like [Microcaecilia unicolor]|uniref:Olfactory receptor 1509-like n=1 Tax=Microcaecilia unicolor TaxID=1415580 RepID=A0A6P7WH15_9AMPH|nr:olfactory receptor 1509-like [Microcaecilia unicolor]
MLFLVSSGSLSALSVPVPSSDPGYEDFGPGFCLAAEQPRSSPMVTAVRSPGVEPPAAGSQQDLQKQVWKGAPRETSQKRAEGRSSGAVDKMEERAVSNETRIKEFILLGLSRNPNFQIIFFVVFLVMYLGTIAGNLLILVTIYMTPQLHTPMYFFLSNLSFIDVGLSTATVPRSLLHFLSPRKTISFGDCIAELFFFHFIGGSECFHLVLMAYDRYVAICNPLRYTTIMNRQVCVLLVVSTWVGGFIHGCGQTFPIVLLTFCGPNEIDHFFCEGHAISMLACSSTFYSDVADRANSGILAIGCFSVLLVSYAYIISTVLKIKSAEGRQKAFSTCASHLIVVTLFYGPIVFLYMRPSVVFEADKLLSVFYTIVTPLLNPCIYTLRNETARNAMKKLGGRKICFRGKHTN